MARTTRRAVSLITMLVALGITATRVPAFAQNAVPGARPAPAGAVTGIGPYLHLVADLDRSLEFYRAVLGSEPTGTAEARAWGRNEPVAVMYGAPGAELRTTSVPVPGSEMTVELVAFRGVERRRVQPHVYDPGAALLLLFVRDIGRSDERGHRPRRLHPDAQRPAGRRSGPKPICHRPRSGRILRRAAANGSVTRRRGRWQRRHRTLPHDRRERRTDRYASTATRWASRCRRSAHLATTPCSAG